MLYMGWVGWDGMGLDGFHRSQALKSTFGANKEI